MYKAKIKAGIERAARALAPNVVRIRYSFQDDWTGTPSFFFRVVLSDKVTDKTRLGAEADKASSTIRREIRCDELDLSAYFNFRSLSETKQLPDPEWD